MIRIKEGAGWRLVEHRDHARLAGVFARHWGNSDFAAPEPRADILEAVARHDDAWAERDAQPCLTRAGLPSAFSHELVGAYSAFEEIDLADYLGVRGRATEAVAADNPYAATLISMHTVNLLTEQANLAGVTTSDLVLHREFILGQRRRQAELVAQVRAAGRAADVEPASLERAFEFLQLCDNLSLITCVRYPQPRALRHQHPRRDGTLVTLVCTPLGDDTYRVSPYPFDGGELRVTVPCRIVRGEKFSSEEEFRAACTGAVSGVVAICLVR
jgi:hypothetical protein